MSRTYTTAVKASGDRLVGSALHASSLDSAHFFATGQNMGTCVFSVGVFTSADYQCLRVHVCCVLSLSLCIYLLPLFGWFFLRMANRRKYFWIHWYAHSPTWHISTFLPKCYTRTHQYRDGKVTVFLRRMSREATFLRQSLTIRSKLARFYMCLDVWYILHSTQRWECDAGSHFFVMSNQLQLTLL